MMILDSLFTSLFGMSVVFLVLVILIVLIQVQSRVIDRIHRQKEDRSAQAATVAPAIPTPTPAAAPVRTPRPPLRLYDTDDKTAAMVMAIVADESGIPPEELIFHSIRLVKES